MILAANAEKSREYRWGDVVEFVLPVEKGQFVKRPAKGVVLSFPDSKKSFVAIDRNAISHRPRQLRMVDVVPATDAWKFATVS